eukprot:COSAG05_NODE_3525_length_2010_cov_1.602826_1_plen_498_part_01
MCTATDAVGVWGLAVRAAPDDGATKLGRLRRGQRVRVMEPDMPRPGWLQVQWLSAPNCAAWIRQSSGGEGALEVYAVLDVADDRGDFTPASELAASVAAAGPLQQGRKWLHGRLGGLGIPGLSVLAHNRLSRGEAEEVRKLVLRKEQAMMEDLINEAMDELSASANELRLQLGSSADSAADAAAQEGGGDDSGSTWLEPWIARAEEVPRVLQMCEGSGSLRSQLLEIVSQPLAALGDFQINLVQRQGELDDDLHQIASEPELRAALEAGELQSLQGEQDALVFFLALAEVALKKKLQEEAEADTNQEGAPAYELAASSSRGLRGTTSSGSSQGQPEPEAEAEAEPSSPASSSLSPRGRRLTDPEMQETDESPVKRQRTPDPGRDAESSERQQAQLRPAATGEEEGEQEGEEEEEEGVADLLCRQAQSQYMGRLVSSSMSAWAECTRRQQQLRKKWSPQKEKAANIANSPTSAGESSVGLLQRELEPEPEQEPEPEPEP